MTCPWRSASMIMSCRSSDPHKAGPVFETCRPLPSLPRRSCRGRSLRSRPNGPIGGRAVPWDVSRPGAHAVPAIRPPGPIVVSCPVARGPGPLEVAVPVHARRTIGLRRLRPPQGCRGPGSGGFRFPFAPEQVSSFEDTCTGVITVPCLSPTGAYPVGPAALLPRKGGDHDPYQSQSP